MSISREHKVLANIDQVRYELAAAEVANDPVQISDCYRRLSEIIIPNLDLITNALDQYGKLTTHFDVKINLQKE